MNDTPKCGPADPPPFFEDDDTGPPAIGSTVEWSTLGGNTYRGVVTEIDNEDMVVMCDDGKERTTTWGD